MIDVLTWVSAVRLNGLWCFFSFPTQIRWIFIDLNLWLHHHLLQFLLLL